MTIRCKNDKINKKIKGDLSYEEKQILYNGGTYAKRGERMGCYPLTIYPDGRVISNFNNEGTYWDIDVFFMFETTDSIG